MLVVVVTVIIAVGMSRECYSSRTPVRILTADETFEVISSNYEFWNQLSDAEWAKRKVTNYREYMASIRPFLVTLKKGDDKTLKNACVEADRQLGSISLPYFNGRKAAELQWKIGVWHGDIYEFGWPHTMGDVVLLPDHVLRSSIANLVSLLMHEKVHIYQRKFPNDVKNYLHHFGFYKLRERSRTSPHDPRPNPDTDNIIYAWKGRPYTEQTVDKNEPNPYKTSQYFEHPNERMAIEIAAMANYE
jgi:hypothetical protein